jgi:curved DNA-binding protein CbpA
VPAEVDYYFILGISRTASLREIQRAFRRIALAHHPDHAKGETARSRFLLACEAYECLRNEATRREHDRTLAEGAPPPPRPASSSSAGSGAWRGTGGAAGRAHGPGTGPAGRRREFRGSEVEAALAEAFGWSLADALADMIDGPEWADLDDEDDAAATTRAGPVHEDAPSGIPANARGVRRIDLDVRLTPREAARGIAFPFRYPIGSDVLEFAISIPAGVRPGARLHYTLPLVDHVWLHLAVHVAVGG